MLFVLYPLHLVLDTEAKKTRRYIVRHHKKNHRMPLRWCQHDKCDTLPRGQNLAGSVPEVIVSQ
jgi:hypothetical protein